MEVLPHYNVIVEGKRLRRYKVLILGESGVGKTAMIMKIIHGRDYLLDGGQQPSLGVDFFNIITEDKVFQVWDTEGKQDYKGSTLSIFRLAELVLYCYDITRKETLDAITKHRKTFLHNRQSTDPNCCSGILVGLKSDLPGRQVSTEQGEELALKMGLMFIEYSLILDDPKIMIKKMEEALDKAKF